VGIQRRQTKEEKKKSSENILTFVTFCHFASSYTKEMNIYALSICTTHLLIVHSNGYNQKEDSGAAHRQEGRALEHDVQQGGGVCLGRPALRGYCITRVFVYQHTEVAVDQAECADNNVDEQVTLHEPGNENVREKSSK